MKLILFLEFLGVIDTQIFKIFSIGKDWNSSYRFDLMKVKMISWKICMIMGFFFDIEGLKKQMKIY
jgi:hypothetical protein